MVNEVFRCDLFLEPDALSRLVFDESGRLGSGCIVRFGSDSLSPEDFSKFVKALRSAAFVESDDQGVPVAARFKVAFIKDDEPETKTEDKGD